MGNHGPGVSRCGILPGLFGVIEMNERIKLLAEQAEKLADEHTKAFTDGTGEWKRSWNEVYDEKFAELIVKECAGVCLAQRDPANLNYKPSEKFAEAVKQHFGVEE
jgi:hypothetical protein